MVALAMTQPTIPDINAPTKWGKQRRRFQIWLVLLQTALPHKGSLPSKSGCHRIVKAVYPMNYTTFCEHFKALEDDGLIVCSSIGKSTIVYIPDLYVQAPDWVEM